MTTERDGRVQEIIDFLDTAPPSIRDWAAEVQASLKADMAPEVSPIPEDAEKSGSHIVTPSDLRTEVPARFRKGRRMHPSTMILATLAVAALVFAIYWIGRPAPDPLSQPMPAGHPPVAQESPRVDMGRVADLEKRIKENPKDVNAHLELSVLLFTLGDQSASEKHLLEVTKIDPTNDLAWYNLGFLYMAKEPPEQDKARQAWETLLDVAPNSERAKVVSNHMESLLSASPSPSPSPSK